MPDLVVLDLGLAQAAHRALVRVFENDDEPIPAWEEGNEAVIEMCCSCTEVEAFGEQKYPDLPTKAAKLSTQRSRIIRSPTRTSGSPSCSQ